MKGKSLPADHPSIDTTARHIADQTLRRHGFSILERRRDNEPLWTRGGQRYTEREALRIARQEPPLTKAEEREQRRIHGTD